MSIVILSFNTYVIQALLCGIFHSINKSRNPNGILDFIIMTFSPFVIFMHIHDREYFKKEN